MERAFNQMVENVERTGKSESADVLFGRDLYRKTEVVGNLLPDVTRRREDNWVAIFLRGAGKPSSLEYQIENVVNRK